MRHEKSTADAVLFWLVETAVIETASENPSIRVSPGAVNLLKFPLRRAG